MEDINSIAKGWLAYTSLEDASPWKSKYEWAFDAVEDLISSDMETAWRLVLLLTDMSDSEHLKANLAAGPLETIISKHGTELIDNIEKEALTNHKFNYLLGGVWQNNIPEDIWLRISQIDKPKW